jgi:hypothetical protein
MEPPVIAEPSPLTERMPPVSSIDEAIDHARAIEQILGARSGSAASYGRRLVAGLIHTLIDELEALRRVGG